ncbi:phosphopentomutase [Amaricoccus macauensis]|uniref:phosphopentomutase n=1 Tax=Amaricoccus macauensis TaxID=57001 RepID=UPI003C7ECA64
MARAFLLVMDSVGCGGAPDAAEFGDEGANTLGHIIQACAEGRAEEGRSGPLKLPNMARLGLGAAIRAASEIDLPGFDEVPQGIWGAATEISQGKDTPSGHWELTGVPVPWDWHYFPDGDPSIPTEITNRMAAEGGLPGTLCNRHYSGIPVIEDFGEEHLRTGKPIVYTSVDSVLQIAAHEDHFGLDRLLELCELTARIVHPMRLGRVIARPFVGEDRASFRRTPQRRDYAIAPPEDTLLDRVVKAGGKTHAIGKIGDIFAHRAITTLSKAKDDMGLVDETVRVLREAETGDFVFANYVEFDSLYGHRRDVSGYARALETFDARIPEMEAQLGPGDLMIITADHGNDPTFRGADHTRERVPVIGTGPGIPPKCLGPMNFADVGETLAAHLRLAPGRHGTNRL